MTTPLRFLTLALLASSTFGLTNCKKDKEPEPDKRSQREIWLTSTGWNRQSVTQVYSDATGTSTTNTASPATFFPPCTLDDIDHYNRDRSFIVDDGQAKCQAPAAASTWDFAANEMEIVIQPSSYRYKIVSLTATTLVLEIGETYPDGTKVTQTTSYAAR